MLFSSMTFLGVFLPLVCGLYLLSKKEFHNTILLIASIIFYAWGEPKYLAIMLLTIIVNYFGAFAIEKYQEKKKIALIFTIIANLSFLVYFKYFNFLIENYNSLFNSNFELLNIVMPIGISFYTFQALSYVIDVYRGECRAQKDFYKLALYISLFPQLVAGPIVKYRDISEQIDSREVNFEKVSYGAKRFVVGLAKKMLIANVMGEIADKIFAQSPDSFSHFVAWIGAFAYSLQLYFDFSGYSDMAIGIGMIFGFRFMENFNYPYISKSITEFWRRWHISLSTWFKQYVYISLGGNRCSKFKTLRNLGIVFLLTGIWHGASWNFVAWGVWHGIFIILEKIFDVKAIQEKQNKWWQNSLWHVYCILIFVVGWVMFRADNLSYALEYLKNMFFITRLDENNFRYSFIYYIDNIQIITTIVALLCAVPLFKNLLLIKHIIIKSVVNLWLLFLLILSISMVASSTYNPFIYFRF